MSTAAIGIIVNKIIKFFEKANSVVVNKRCKDATLKIITTNYCPITKKNLCTTEDKLIALYGIFNPLVRTSAPLTGHQDFIVSKMFAYFGSVAASSSGFHAFTSPESERVALTVLDVGGGNGDVLQALAEKYMIPPPNAVCYEPSAGEFSNTYAFNNPGISYVSTLDAADERHEWYDVMIFMVSLHHMTTEFMQQQMIPFIQRKCPIGGYIILKEHDVSTQSIRTAVEWEHHLYHITSDIATPATDATPAPADIKEKIKKYLDELTLNLRDKEFFTKRVFPLSNFRIVETLSNVFEPVDDETFENTAPSRLYWQILQRVC